MSMIQKELGIFEELEKLKDRKMQPAFLFVGKCHHLLPNSHLDLKTPFSACSNALLKGCATLLRLKHSSICISTAQTGKGSVLTVFRANSVFLGTRWDWWNCVYTGVLQLNSALNSRMFTSSESTENCEGKRVGKQFGTLLTWSEYIGCV